MYGKVIMYKKFAVSTFYVEVSNVISKIFDFGATEFIDV